MKVARNLGVLLIEFLEFYGKALNYTDVGIAFRNSSAYLFSKRTQGMYLNDRPNSLCILDPQDSSNDVPRGSYAIHVVRQAFGKAFIRISSIIAEYENQMYNYNYEMQQWEDGISRRKPKRPQRPNTVLGSIITINKAVIEHRDYIAEKYVELSREFDSSIFEFDTLTTVPKDVSIPGLRSTSSSGAIIVDSSPTKPEEEVVYIEDESANSTDDERIQNLLRDFQKDNASDDGDITSYYNM
jgi:DNA polymerase sigma